MLEEHRPTVINFRPWLVSDRDALLPALFRELTVAIDSVYEAQGDSTRASLTKAKDAAVAVRRFASALGRAGDFVQFAGDVSALPPVTWAGKGIKAIGGAFGKEEKLSLSRSKDKLVSALQELDHAIIVTIDDIDRLEPRDAFEVLRLIRSVADLPNVTYLLCYDSDILAESIQETAGIKNGHVFLEKIVQLTVMVPTPEPFQLRNWFTDELKKIGAPSTDKGLERLREVVNWDGGRRLRTPRGVIRALDSIRFMWPALQSESADFSDLVWLQLIKNDNLKLYRWIESYLSSQSVIALQIGQVDQADKDTDIAALAEADTDGFFKSLYYRHHFAEHLPGMDANFDNAATAPKIYEKVSKHDYDRAIADKRVSSPDHYRLYFSLAVPSHTITQGELAGFWESLEGPPEAAAAEFVKLYEREIQGSFSKADVLLERLNTATVEGLSPKRSENLLRLFSNVMDEIYRIRPVDVFWVDTIWDRAQRLMPRLLGAVGSQRVNVVSRMFRDGPALEWLTNVLRRETFAHGRYGDQAKPEGERILTAQELDSVSSMLIDRYSKLSAQQLVGLAEPLNLLFAWLQAGDDAGPRKLVQKAIKSDVALLSLLESMRGTVTSTGGRYYTLKRSSLEPFMDFEKTRARVEKLAEKKEKPELAAKASVLLDSFRAGDRGF